MGTEDRQIANLVDSMLDAVSSGDSERKQIYLNEFNRHASTAIGEAVDAAATCRQVLQRLNLIDEPVTKANTAHKNLFNSVVIFN